MMDLHMDLDLDEYCANTWVISYHAQVGVTTATAT